MLTPTRIALAAIVVAFLHRAHAVCGRAVLIENVKA